VGRTNPTYRDQLRRVEERWQSYRRALRADDRRHFDRLFEHARAHADAAGYQNHHDPTVPLLLAALLAHERRLAALEDAGLEHDTGRDDGDGDGGAEVT
jgi:hypothetical protein